MKYKAYVRTEKTTLDEFEFTELEYENFIRNIPSDSLLYRLDFDLLRHNFREIKTMFFEEANRPPNTYFIMEVKYDDLKLGKITFGIKELYDPRTKLRLVA